MGNPHFPGFEIIETLPRGGMSTVYKARQISLDRIVALKALPPTLAAEASDLSQFLAEARITANLKHPNIVQVYDFGHTEEGVYYFVMEFISGYSVGDWIRRKHCLSEQNSLLVAASVAEALNYAWKNARVVHCDIKPDNIIIDGDGTVKVADLGLAKSVRSVVNAPAASAGMVFGTPNYISPEQSRGDPDLDCRADIYSLGATLYHAMGGKMPFEGAPATAAMDLQISEQIADIQELNPHVSPEAAALLELLLAKDRARRPESWDAALADINRVIQHKMPLEALPPPGGSTMRRSVQRGAHPRVKASATMPIKVLASDLAPDHQAFQDMQRQFLLKHKPRPGLRPEWWFAAVIALAVLILGVMVVRGVLRSRASAGGRPGVGGPAVPGGQGPGYQAPHPAEAWESREEQLRQMLELARSWARDNPDKIEAAMRNFRQVANEARDTPYFDPAMAEIAKCQEKLLAARNGVMRELERQAAPLVAANEFGKAADLYTRYQGAWAADTEPARKLAARDLREREEKFRDQQQRLAEEAERQHREAEAEAERQMAELGEQACAGMLDGDIARVLAAVQQAAARPDLASRREPLERLAGMLTEAARLEPRVLATFRANQGQELTVALASGSENLVIREVREDAILAEKVIKVGAGSINQPRTLRFADLALSEKRQRLMAEGRPDTPLLQGLLSVRERDWATAESWFAKADPLVSAGLLAEVGRRKSAQGEEQARRELMGILRAVQVEGVRDNSSCEECLAAIARKTFGASEAALLAKALERYAAGFGQSQFARQYAPVLKALERVSGRAAQPPAQEDRPAIEPAPRPAHPDRLQPADVRRKLMERNPELAFQMLSVESDSAGKIVRVRARGGLKDLEPLADLPDLQVLDLPDNYQITDLAPLKGKPLEDLNLNGSQVKDLAPLDGMPLKRLDLGRTKITDLSPLKGMPLESLGINQTRVKDLEPLRNMPLTSLFLKYTDVADLGPLKTIRSLERLFIGGTQVQSLFPLKGMPLAELDIEETKARDVSHLAGMPLTTLLMSGSKASDFLFLSSLQLRKLDVSRTDFQDVNLLRGMPLEDLNLSGTRIRDRDLAVLQALPLRNLFLNDTSVTDLEPLSNIPSLRSLGIRQTKIKNLELLQDMPIESLWLDMGGDRGRHEKIWLTLRRMSNLRQLNGNQLYRDGWRGR